MANELSFNFSLSIRKDNLNYRLAKSFRADVATAKGPTPGAVTVPTTGVDISIDQLTDPGVCAITNLDSTNYLLYGIWDGAVFHPLGEVLPGETWVFRLFRNLGNTFGTGTSIVDNETLRLKATGAQLDAVVEIFDA